MWDRGWDQSRQILNTLKELTNILCNWLREKIWALWIYSISMKNEKRVV